MSMALCTLPLALSWPVSAGYDTWPWRTAPYFQRLSIHCINTYLLLFDEVMGRNIVELCSWSWFVFT